MGGQGERAAVRMFRVDGQSVGGNDVILSGNHQSFSSVYKQRLGHKTKTKYIIGNLRIKSDNKFQIIKFLKITI